MSGVTSESVSQHYPRLYHMAHIDSWPSIAKHGLLSTCALVDLFEADAKLHDHLMRCHRPESITLRHCEHGQVVIRDQKPMSDAALIRCLQDGLSPADWYEMLNRRVFFWPTKSRLYRMAKARAYKDDCHLFIEVDTMSLLDKHYEKVLLSPINSGCTLFTPQPRGNATFLPPAQHPFDERKKISGEGFAELLVEHSVPDFVDHVVEVWVGKETERLDKIYAR